jgi:hypothetical protein
MPWLKRPTKDVAGCDKPREAVNKRYTRGCPNGETHAVVDGIRLSEKIA